MTDHPKRPRPDYLRINQEVFSWVIFQTDPLANLGLCLFRRRTLQAVAAGHDEAFKFLQARLPSYTIRKSARRLSGPRMEDFRPGEARRVFP